MKITYYLALFALFLLPELLSGKGKIAGKIVDGESGEELIGATVLIKENGNGTVTDLYGNYVIELNAGTYSLNISYVSYSAQTIENVIVKDGQTTEINVALSSNMKLEEIVVQATAIKDNDVSLLKIQRQSLNVQDGISSMQIKKLGASDAAESMTYVTGASIEDGKYMVMRGLGDRYSLVTMNNILMPSTDPYRNSVSLDLIPADMIDNLVTIKTFSPDKPGNFTGGLIDVTTRAIPSDFYLNLSLSGSFNPVSSFNNDFLSDNVQSNRALATNKGLRDKPAVFEEHKELLIRNAVDQTRLLAIVPDNVTEREILNEAAKSLKNNFLPTTLSSLIDHSVKLATGNQYTIGGKPIGYNLGINYDRRFRVFDEFRTGYYSPLNKDSLIQEQALNRQRSMEEVQYGGLLSLSFQPSINNELTFITLYNRNAETMADEAVGFWRNPQTNDYHSTQISFIDRSIWNNQLSGKHVIKGMKVGWSAGYLTQKQDQPDYRGFGYAINNGVYVMRTSEIGRLPTHFFRYLDDSQLNGQFDITIPFTLNKENIVKFGASYSNKSREFNEYLITQHREPASSQPGIQDDYTGFTNAAGDLERYFNNDNYGLVNNGEPGINTSNGRTEYGFGTLYSDQSVLGNNYTGNEIISAAYLMAAYYVLPKLQLVGGARLENTDMETISADTTRVSSGELDPDGNPIFISRNGNIQKLDVLPSVNLIWKVGENSNIRLSYSRTIARPNMREISPFVSLGTPEDPQFLGNSRLKRSVIDNYDLRYEFYPRPGEFISFSAYYKNFNDPIVIQNLTQASTAELKPVNTSDARVFGFEIEFRKSLDFILPALENFSLGTNLSIINSRVNKDTIELISIAGTNIKDWRPLQGQSPYIINAILSYESESLGWENTLSLNVFGQRLSYVSNALTPDVYEAPRPVLNFVSSKRVGNKTTIGLKAKNLLNALYLQEFLNDNFSYVFESYRQGPSFEVSVGYNFR